MVHPLYLSRLSRPGCLDLPLDRPLRVSTILSMARSRTPAPHTPVTTQPVYIALPQDETIDCTYDVDRTGQSELANEKESNECPGHLDEMLKIVKDPRRIRYEALQLTPTRNVDTETIHEVSQERRSGKESNCNNFAKTNLEHFL